MISSIHGPLRALPKTACITKNAAVSCSCLEVVAIVVTREVQTTDEKFLTAAEVARIMRVSTMTVYRLIHAGELEAIRVGRSFRVSERAVDEYIKAAFVVPNTES